MKRILFALATAIFFFGGMVQPLKASHEMGGDIYYDCISYDPVTNTYVVRVFLKLYADCAGASTIIYGTPPANLAPRAGIPGLPAAVPLTPWTLQPSVLPNGTSFIPSAGNQAVVTPICQNPLVRDQCQDPNSPLPGVVEAIWARDYRIGATGPYDMVYNQCCRNPGILNVGPNQAGTFISTPINPRALPIGGPGTGCNNNSPRFNNPPAPYLCLGQLISFNQAATDPDGDSLAYRLGTPFSGPGTPMTWLGGFSQTNPMPSAPLPPPLTFLNPTNGTITVNPTALGKYMVVVVVDEFRNKIKIGEITREIQFTVIDCNVLNPSPDPNLPPLMDSVNTKRVNGQFFIQDTVCAGNPITLNFRAIDPNGPVGANPKQIVGMTVSGIPAGATFTTGAADNPTFGVFTWPSVPLSPQPYQFVINMKDDGCPLNLTQQFVVRIVALPSIRVNVTTNRVCNDVTFTANVLTGVPPYNVVWSGAGGLGGNPNSNNLTLTHTYPGPGSYPYTVSIGSPGGCDTTINGVVVIPNTAVTINAGADATLCSAIPYTLGDVPSLGHTYSWSPATFLSDPSVSNPTVNKTNTGTTNDTLIYTLTASNGPCQAQDRVIVVVRPAPSASIVGNTAVCQGDIITLAGPANQPGYLWSTGQTSRVIQFPAPGFPATVTLNTIGANGCLSPTQSYTVNATPTPQTVVVGDTFSCEGNPITITAAGGTTLLWNDGSTLPQRTFNLNVNTSLNVWVLGFNNVCRGDTVFRTLRSVPDPVANITLDSPDSVQCNRVNSFDFDGTNGTTAGANMVYEWRFGPGSVPSVSTALNPDAVTYFTPGVKRVSLLARNTLTGCVSDTAFYTLRVLDKPVATFAQPAPQCSLGHVFTFTYTGTPANFFRWEFPGSINMPLYNGPNPPFVAWDSPGVKNFTLYAGQEDLASGIRCIDTVTGSITIWPTPDSPLTFDDNVCLGQTATVNAQTVNGGVLVWYTVATGGTPFQVGPTSFTRTGLQQNTTYFVAERNQFGCESVRTRVDMIVNPLPQISARSEAKDLELPLAITTFSARVTPNAVFYQWDLGDGTISTDPAPVHQYRTPGSYTISLTVRDSNGCINSIVYPDYVVVYEPLEIQMPSAFSPNGDGLNDEFFMVTKLIDQMEIGVFNRWGEEVYRSNNVNFRWDGRDKGNQPVPEGVYTYYMKGNYWNGKGFNRTGSVTVIR